jgi:hypothetical protein
MVTHFFTYHLYNSNINHLIMRKTVSSILVSLLVICSCKKSPSNPVPAPVNSGVITITGISPAIPYADDEITIMGTGFNPDKTKDTVDFGGGDPASGFFEPYAQGLNNSSKTVIVSATATQLVIKSVNPDSTASGLDWQLFKAFNIGLNANNRVRVRSNGNRCRPGGMANIKLLDEAQ